MSPYRDELFLSAADLAFLERRRAVWAYRSAAERGFARGVATGIGITVALFVLIGMLF